MMRSDIDEFEDDLNHGVMRDEERENCIKGRLTALYKMAIVWRKNQHNFVSDSKPDSRFLTPCKMFWLRHQESLSR